MDLLFAAFVSFRFREIKFFLEKLNSFWIKSCISQSNCILHLESLKPESNIVSVGVYPSYYFAILFFFFCYKLRGKT